MEITPSSLPWKSLYKLMIGSIVPRAIGWVSTVNEAGQPNLAPFSFFTAAGANPPHVLFCPLIRETDGHTKDTLHNVRASGEFVVNIVTEALGPAMNITSTEFPAEVNEFAAAELTPIPSVAVRPPRVAESPIHYECKLTQIVELGKDAGAASVVIGQVVHLHVDDSVLIGGDKIDIAQLRPIGRLAGNGYCRVAPAMFDLVRPPSQIG
ncbi:MAG: flavin reductase family protein [Caldilineae bacterium]|nr:flavin reductase family protein [Anaerolineae bacterium]MCB0200834.1 flavin reductase family protein [Anaerolineae bacterium]MCB0203755.1 flavin reductase family protein [Anaerolineae bacterium]MCB9141624.1 flavin reductase family protein [Anaerolineales bacterium]MCB9154969.1 flavin reductase family protein [Caldilineae bacterium]